MDDNTVITTFKATRRLFVKKQHLTGETGVGTFSQRITGLIRELGYIQWDPVTVVAPSHLISLWSRIGVFDTSDLDKIMWVDKEAFLHWTPTAVLVLMEDYPIFYSLMKGYPDSLSNSWRSHIEPAVKFLETHRTLRKEVMDRLSEGPAEIKQFRNYGKRMKSEDGWSSGNEVSTLLYHLHMLGEVMVSGHVGNQNKWSLSENFLPAWAERRELPVEELERMTAIRSIRALGVASTLDVNRYFVRGRYRNLEATLNELENEGTLLKVKIDGEKRARKTYVHSDDLGTLQDMEKSMGKKVLKLISPFDNLITIRERTRRLFNFEYILEQFIPKEKRKFGTYVLPILWGDGLVGRIDMKFDKTSRVLKVNSIHAEKGQESDHEIPVALDETLRDFCKFIGADKMTYGKIMPVEWSKYLAE